MPKRLIFTIVSFHISAALFALIGLLISAATFFTRGAMHQLRVGFPHNDPVMGYMANTMSIYMGVMIIVAALLPILCAIGIEYVIRGLNQRKYWAWITGIVICGLMIITGTHNLIGLALGVLGLIGLLDQDSIAAFKPAPGNAEADIDQKL